MKNTLFSILTAVCVMASVPTTSRAQTVISNLGQPVSYNASINPPARKAAGFLSGIEPTRITGLSLRVQQGGFGTFTGTFVVSLFLADNTTHAPTGSSLVSDTLGFTMTGQTSATLIFDGTDLVSLGGFTLNPNTKYSLVFSDSTEVNFGLLTTASATYTVNNGFASLGTLSSSDNGASWGSYAGTQLIYAMSGVTAVPEPSTYALLAGSAALVLAGWVRVRRRKL